MLSWWGPAKYWQFLLEVPDTCSYPPIVAAWSGSNVSSVNLSRRLLTGKGRSHLGSRGNVIYREGWGSFLRQNKGTICTFYATHPVSLATFIVHSHCKCDHLSWINGELFWTLLPLGHNNHNNQLFPGDTRKAILCIWHCWRKHTACPLFRVSWKFNYLQESQCPHYDKKNTHIGDNAAQPFKISAPRDI